MDYKVGQVYRLEAEDGPGDYKYLGGDPASRESWQLVNSEAAALQRMAARPGGVISGGIADFLASLSSGATFGFDDEIAGMINGPEARDNVRQYKADRELLNPGANMAGEAAGGFLLPGLAGRAGARAVGGRVGGMLGGAAGGGAGAALGAAGEASGGAQERLGAAGAALGPGMAVGGLLGGVGAAAGRAGVRTGLSTSRPGVAPPAAGTGPNLWDVVTLNKFALLRRVLPGLTRKEQRKAVDLVKETRRTMGDEAARELADELEMLAGVAGGVGAGATKLNLDLIEEKRNGSR